MTGIRLVQTIDVLDSLKDFDAMHSADLQWSLIASGLVPGAQIRSRRGQIFVADETGSPIGFTPKV